MLVRPVMKRLFFPGKPRKKRLASLARLMKIVISSLVCVLVLVYLCVHRRWSIERHLNIMDFGCGRGCGGPYLAAPPNSARVQNSVEFVEHARDMSSNGTGEVQAITGISRWYHRLQAVAPPRARFTCSMNIPAGIFNCVRIHCGVRVAYHTWELGAGIMCCCRCCCCCCCFCCCLHIKPFFLPNDISSTTGVLPHSSS